MTVVWEIFIACVVIQLLYYIAVFGRLNFTLTQRRPPEYFPPVSVIICAKNEAKNLRENLKVVLIQQFKTFEVIVVNDQSDDDTIDVLVDYYKRNENLKIVNIPKDEQKTLAGKKYALLKGVEVASFDTLVFTDADCRPASSQWLARLVGDYMHETKIVLGHSPYERGFGFLNKVIRYENFMTAMQYFGFAKAGLPYMGVGRNLSYKKEILNGFRGFEKNKDILTGDDDLLVNETATKQNTEICLNKDAFMYSAAQETVADWLNQKKRHLRSGFKYKFIHQALLFVFAATGVGIYMLFIPLIVKGFMLKWLLGLFFGFLFLKMLITFGLYKRLGAEDLRIFSPVLDITYALYLVTIFVLLLFKPKDNWKS